ncbi:putative short-chain reductase/dehydrogenase SDR 3-oxoacyl-(acyl-carrier-protein) reductase NAD(P)-binding domain [Magnetospirillum sp. LM-5]|uniref:SDR family oxidoreductase n=1 Tax=Magnetospirillum sp. LM-5 TaxID=2681466 RepID=UPI001382D126|nr:SDR family oxidoreductase [Magnetospirillum sp. LM-5]CAA7614455.1 putative short-chain reductase/dehydrogenase SDR 3-oxoacyl-(acyl-carrier-protein) reductase NAD(P)-binding domain [Magnetospirillum sp. LM-5]
MDLGLSGRRALVCAASRGLGKACALALAAEGCEVLIIARRPDILAHAADDIHQQTGAKVEAVAADVTTPEGRARVLAAMPDPDILVTNAGGPPPGDFHDWDRDTWIKALDANMLAPIELIKATIDSMMVRRWGRIVNITSGAVKAPIDVLGLSNGARSGLTGFVAGLARASIRHGVTINNLLPGPFDTDRLAQVLAAQAAKDGVAVEEAARRRAGANPAGRFGDPAEFGAFCAFLCSDQAGYMTGQNILLDGGAYPGVF